MTKDISGRPWLTVAQAKPGVVIEHDFGSDCWTQPTYILEHDEKYGLGFKCAKGWHCIDGQLDFDIGQYYIGLYLGKPQ